MQKYYFTNPNGVRKLVLKMVSKFHNDSTVEESRIVVLLGQVLGLCGERER